MDDPALPADAGKPMQARSDATAPRLRSATLSHRKPGRFRWIPDAEGREALARSLDLPAITSLSFRGEILPEGRADFRLEGRLQADLMQSCVVTLAPVPAQIDEKVTRRFLAEWSDPEAEEQEMPEDDSLEPLPEIIDIGEIAAEALTLALPPYPRAEGAELGEAVHAAPGVQPLKDADLNPFAGLASILKKGEKPDEGTGS